ncbi:MAG TPA: hypothetical protein VGW38_07645 [Chloroflexota bacterium]|nr:hypothetical protein [Chloroflexota bacterium]
MTRPVGLTALSDAEAATRVRRFPWEHARKPVQNHRVPRAADLVALRSLNTMPTLVQGHRQLHRHDQRDHPAGRHKWGIDENLVRAQAVRESCPP